MPAFPARLLALLLACMAAACAQVPPSATVLSSQPDDTRKLQSRLVSTRDEKQLLDRCSRSLQLMGYTIDQADPALGLVIAHNYVKTMTTGEQIATAVLVGLLVGPYNVRYTMAENTVGSVVLRPYDDRRTEVRLTALKAVINNQGAETITGPVMDPLEFKKFFDGMALPEWTVEDVQ